MHNTIENALETTDTADQASRTWLHAGLPNTRRDTTTQPQQGVGTSALFADWPDDRITELSELRDMLHEISGLNRGSDFLGKVQRSISLAEKLTRTNFAARRKSFCAFLQDQAFKSSANADLRQPVSGLQN